MRTTIYRQRLVLAAPPERVVFPAGCRVLSVQRREGNRDTVDVWAEVDPEQPDQGIAVTLVGTGHAEVPPAPARYVSTLQLAGGGIVLHAYVEGDVDSGGDR